ncbi:MAG TPA: ABC transporter ATP-binding protein [Candidatus Cloacimonas sp.]|nr:ABC transporter ATP-binding protein [Candidatus Cloacimonas sp.]
MKFKITQKLSKHILVTGRERIMLKLNNIETWYDIIRVLHGISIEVRKGDIVALLGTNGAGKSTTLKTIMRMLYDEREEQPEKGTIEFEGIRIDRKNPAEIVRMGISLVPEGREVFPELTVWENIIMGAYLRNDRKKVKEDMEKVFTYFPIFKERTKQEAGYLSGGEQQMLAIGRALMSHPKLLLLDEPSLGLSPLLITEIFEIIKNINKQDGVSILLVEQNVNMALEYADFAYLMENGRIVRADKPQVLLEDEDVKEFYLGISTETSVKGYKRYRRKVRFR